MAKEILFVVEQDEEGRFTAKCMGHSICTEAATMEELKQMVRDAVACHFSDSEKPPVIHLHIVKDEAIQS